MYHQALELLESLGRDQSPYYAGVLQNIAGIHGAIGEYPRAEELFHQALAIREGAQGKQHADYGETLNGTIAAAVGVVFLKDEIVRACRGYTAGSNRC